MRRILTCTWIDIDFQQKYLHSPNPNPPSIIVLSYGAEICPSLVQLIGHVSALIGDTEIYTHVVLSFFRVNIKN